MRRRWWVFAWPLLLGWPLLVLALGPRRPHQPAAPFHIGPLAFQHRDSPQVRAWLRVLDGAPMDKPLAGCTVADKLDPHCRSVLFAYLLSWQGDPDALRPMFDFFQQHAEDRHRLKVACETWAPPGTMAHGADHADDLWRRFCGKAS